MGTLLAAQLQHCLVGVMFVFLVMFYAQHCIILRLLSAHASCLPFLCSASVCSWLPIMCWCFACYCYYLHTLPPIGAHEPDTRLPNIQDTPTEPLASLQQVPNLAMLPIIIGTMCFFLFNVLRLVRCSNRL